MKQLILISPTINIFFQGLVSLLLDCRHGYLYQDSAVRNLGYVTMRITKGGAMSGSRAVHLF